MQKILCKVQKVVPLTSSVMHVELMPEKKCDYHAGQYLQILMSDSDKRPFSIANAPRPDGSLELHIGSDPANKYASQVLQKLQSEPHVEAEIGLGKAFLRTDKIKPTILLAGGTGFSYTLAILQKLLASPLKEPVFLYWGTRTIEDMYAFDFLTELAQQHAKFKFVPVIEYPPAGWKGKTAWVHKAVLSDFTSLSSYQVYVAGRFEMAGVVREEFHLQGLSLDNLYGDAYEFI
jgi:NAD(P)H-flavin reductase